MCSFSHKTSPLLESDLRYTERQLSRENKTNNWQTRRIRELEEEVAKLKNRTLWQQIWVDIKPKRTGKSNLNAYLPSLVILTMIILQ